MDGVKTSYVAKTADPSTSLRSGRDDKGRAVTFRKGGDLDGRSRALMRTEFSTATVTATVIFTDRR
jgi:hypothetical protein